MEGDDCVDTNVDYKSDYEKEGADSAMLSVAKTRQIDHIRGPDISVSAECSGCASKALRLEERMATQEGFISAHLDVMRREMESKFEVLRVDASSAARENERYVQALTEKLEEAVAFATKRAQDAPEMSGHGNVFNSMNTAETDVLSAAEGSGTTEVALCDGAKIKSQASLRSLSSPGGLRGGVETERMPAGAEQTVKEAIEKEDSESWVRRVYEVQVRFFEGHEGRLGR